MPLLEMPIEYSVCMRTMVAGGAGCALRVESIYGPKARVRGFQSSSYGPSHMKDIYAVIACSRGEMLQVCCRMQICNREGGESDRCPKADQGVSLPRGGRV